MHSGGFSRADADDTRFSSNSIAGSVGPALSLLPQSGRGVTVAPLPPALLLLVQNADSRRAAFFRV